MDTETELCGALELAQMGLFLGDNLQFIFQWLSLGHSIIQWSIATQWSIHYVWCDIGVFKDVCFLVVIYQAMSFGIHNLS